MDERSIPAPKHLSNGEVPRAVIIGVIHLVTGPIGVGVMTALCWYATQELLHVFFPSFTQRKAAYLLLEVPGYPLQFIQGAYLGFLIVRRFGGKISIFTWVLPLSVLILLWLLEPSTRPSFFEHFSSNGRCGLNDGCFEKALATLWFVSSAGYSTGASFGLTRRKNQP
jgi:hypothetical protein